MSLVELVCWTLALWALSLAAIYLARWTGVPLWAMSFFEVAGVAAVAGLLGALWRRRHPPHEPPTRS